VEDVFVGGGPPLLPPKVEAVDEVAGKPLLTDLGPRLILLGVVEGGEARCGTGADDLGEVEGGIAVVSARDQDAADGVERTLTEAAVAEGIEAVVLVEEYGSGAADHEVLVRSVGKGVPVVSGVAFDALVELGVGVTIHCEAGLNRGYEERRVVEAVLGCEGQFFFWRLGRQFYVSGDRAEVGDDAEDALGLLAAFGVGSVGVVRLGRLGWICRLSGLGEEQGTGRVREIDGGYCCCGIVLGWGAEA